MAVQLSKYGYERREVAVVNGHREEDPGPGDLLSKWEDIFTNCSHTLLFNGEFNHLSIATNGGKLRWSMDITIAKKITES